MQRLPNTCIPRTTLRAWKGLELQPKDRKISQNRKGKHVQKGAHSGRLLSYNEDIEDQLLQWILEARDQQLPIQRKAIQRKALALIQPQKPEFWAWEGWLQKFLNSHMFQPNQQQWFGHVCILNELWFCSYTCMMLVSFVTKWWFLSNLKNASIF